MIPSLIYDSPSWVVTLAVFASGLAFALACQALVRRFLRREALESHSDLVSFTVTNIAVLYGVLLAFLTVASWEGLSKASETAGVEASLVANLYHDAQGLAPPLAADISGHVVRYLRVVVDTEWPEQARGRVPPDGTASLATLHRHVAQLSPADRGDAVVMGDMMRVLNQIDGARAARLEALGGQIPGLIWTLIVAMGLLLIGFAALIPAEDARIHAAMLGGLVLAIALVLVMIVELDSPFRGAIRVSVDPYVHVLADVLKPAPAEAD